MIGLQQSTCTRPNITNGAPVLLQRLQADPQDSELWAQFAQVYGPTIHRWCRRWGLQESDAEDVIQDVFLNLVCRIGRFYCDPNRSFRAWLQTVTRNQWLLNVSRQRKAVRGCGGDGFTRQVERLEARDDSNRRMEEVSDWELLDKAAASVRERVEAKTWGAFRLTAVDGYSGAEAACQLGMEVGSVFVARSRILRMLRDEIVRIQQG